MWTVEKVDSLFAVTMGRYCEPLVVWKYSWRLVGAVFGFRRKQQEQTVRMCRDFSLHHRPGCYQFDRPGRGRVMTSGIPLGGTCVGDLHGP